MRFCKKIIITVVFSILFILFQTTDITYAISENEIQKIETNTTVEDKLTSVTDINYYKFQMDTDGYYQIVFSVPGVDIDTGKGWKITLLKEDGNSIICTDTTTTGYTSRIFSFKQGMKFYLKIEVNYEYSAPINVLYNLQIKTTTNTECEIEDNNAFTEATEITNNIPYLGTLYQTNDEDFFHYTVNKTGYFTFSFDIKELDANVGRGWKISLYVNDQLKDTYTCTADTKSCPYSFTPDTSIYIKIEPTYIYDVPTDVNYNLTINQVETNDWEREWNDTAKTATAIANDVTYYGTTMSYEDTDYYKLSVSKYGFLTLYFYVNNLNSDLGYGYDFIITNKNNNTIYDLKKITSNQTLKLYLAKGTYYVKINVNYQYSAPSCYNIYNLKTKFAPTSKPAQTTIKSLKESTYTQWFSTYDTISIKIKSIKNVSGYEVQIATSPKFTKNKSTHSIGTSGTVGEKLLRKTKYYVRARAYYETPTGKRTYGKWSAIKSVKTK